MLVSLGQQWDSCRWLNVFGEILIGITLTTVIQDCIVLGVAISIQDKIDDIKLVLCLNFLKFETTISKF